MDTVFHFTSFESLKYIISKDEFRISNVKKLNDIDESEAMVVVSENEMPRFLDEITKCGEKKSKELLNNESFTNKLKDKLKENCLEYNKNLQRLNTLKDSCYIASFGSVPNEFNYKKYYYISNISLMWSHYANKYNGVCIIFDKNKLDVFFNKMAKEQSYKVISMKLKYKSDYFYKFKNIKCDKMLLKEKYFVKNTSWSIENEYRYLIYNIQTKKKSKEDYLFFKGIRKCIDSIIFSGTFKGYKNTVQKIIDHNITIYSRAKGMGGNHCSVGLAYENGIIFDKVIPLKI